MSEGRAPVPIMPISGIIALLAVIGITFYSQTPLKGTRPYSAEIQNERSDNVRARLWQDPFDAVLEHLKVLKKTKIKPNAETINLMGPLAAQQSANRNMLKKQIKLKVEEKNKVTVLGVMVPGTEYAEDGECRMRQRYAVLSGLRNREFAPEDSEHIKYTFFTTDSKQQNESLLFLCMPECQLRVRVS